ncbi:Asp-tRNA(Asn)/Glu-tRNA(Gln) amidotransferase subunit GatC [Salisediminibacterium beveridgei]|uniref:Aspartyl/glutamyl-tRNA(Asn/Gln) amidotransferase subunit C n=1 Tax=Salisediminibacterium beveridgei TaxID=632773 RepID=A0A1D7QY35_9BACI|nr:Asp-tRNA(Asn)/Glu-tRNA(Gln) amidotransferase subunit GatC [Salisediminibacterium beveridgei]AOM83921.1 Aspartyl-tRNA(Asn) amidotransferase subunit C / Glutamyl-tRNA(Gln) amidotransferase subunit C [Salisediminibacterium beveridgei]
MTRITKEQVQHVADLARLTFSEDEIESYTDQLGKIIEFSEQLNEVNTDGVKPTSHAIDVQNVLREDVVKPSPTRKDTMKNAPDQADGQYKVQSVLD